MISLGLPFPDPSGCTVCQPASPASQQGFRLFIFFLWQTKIDWRIKLIMVMMMMMIATSFARFETLGA